MIVSDLSYLEEISEGSSILGGAGRGRRRSRNNNSVRQSNRTRQSNRVGGTSLINVQGNASNSQNVNGGSGGRQDATGNDIPVTIPVGLL